MLRILVESFEYWEAAACSNAESNESAVQRLSCNVELVARTSFSILSGHQEASTDVADRPCRHFDWNLQPDLAASMFVQSNRRQMPQGFSVRVE